MDTGFVGMRALWLWARRRARKPIGLGFQGDLPLTDAKLCSLSRNRLLQASLSPRGRRDRGSDLHRITSVARNMIDSGTLMRSALAVFKFTTKSNLVGCSNGNWLGFAPFKIRCTKSPARE